MLNYLLAFAFGCVVSNLFKPKKVFDAKSKEMYIEIGGKKLYLTRGDVKLGSDVFIDDIKQETRLKYVYGLPNAATKSSFLRIQKITGDKEVLVEPKESFLEKLKTIF